MHSQKNSEIRQDLTKARCALATATCLQHPERLTRPWRQVGENSFQAGRQHPAESTQRFFRAPSRIARRL
jgi:hypothetical protein